MNFNNPNSKLSFPLATNQWKNLKPNLIQENISHIIVWESFDMLTSRKDKAEVISLSDNKTSFDFSDRNTFNWNEDETWLINSIINNPTTNLLDLQARQRLFEELMSEKVFSLDELRKQKWNSRGFWTSLSHLWWVDREERKIAERENRESRTRIEVLKDNNVNFTFETFSKIENIIDSWWKLDKETLNSFKINDWNIISLLNLKNELNYIKAFIKSLRLIANPIIQDLANKLEVEFNKIYFPSLAYFVKLYIDWKDEDINIIFSQTSKISDILDQIWSLVSIGQKINSDWYSKVTFYETKPIEYKNAWQFKRAKKSQVTNDSMKDTQWNLLVWDIMSWKSFQWELNKQLLICAQSIWYAPASEANIHIFDRFISIDRALTDSWKWLSAFGEDITNINKLLDLDNKWWKTYLLMDEWWSTTSPEDQAVLLRAILAYITEKGIKVVIATHNEEFVKLIQGQHEYSTYHLQDKLNDDGTITFLYKLTEWIWESHILEVANTLWLPENICNAASEYLNWNIIKAIAPELDIKNVTSYTPEEREKLKLQDWSFMVLMPYEDEIVIRKKDTYYSLRDDYVDLKVPVLKWRYSIDSEDYDDRKWWYIPEEKPKYEKLIKIVSDDNEVNNARFQWLKMKHYQEVSEFINRSPIRTSKELLEIQKMFEELNNVWSKELSIDFNNLHRFLWHVNLSLYTIREHSKNFLKFLFSSIYKEFNEKKIENINQDIYDNDFVNSFKLFILSININLKLSWKKMDSYIKKKIDIFYMLLNSVNIYFKENKKIDKKINSKEITKEEWRRLSNELYKQLENSIIKLSWIDKTKVGNYYDMSELLTKWCKKIWENIYSHQEDKIKSYNLFDVDIHLLMQMIKKEKSAINWFNWLWNDWIRFLCWLYAILWNDINVYEIIWKLKNYDSVYLHQISNYLENILKQTLWDVKNWYELFEITGNSLKTNEKWRQSNIHIPQVINYEKFSNELWKLQILIDLANMIKTNNLCKVQFNQTGSIVLDEPFNPNKKPENQVKNRFYFWDDQRVVIKTWANMSWKTHSLKHTIWPLAFANTIWYAPAKLMQTPLIDKIYWVDRIKARQNSNLSAWWTEVKVLKSIFDEIMVLKWLKIGFFDEMWSTVPPRFQTALTYATIKELIERWVYVDISHHNHDFITKITENHPDVCLPVHFKTNILDNWTVSFDYIQEVWHTESQALIVAKTCWLIQEILDIAYGINK